jgi:hypothetical protein
MMISKYTIHDFSDFIERNLSGQTLSLGDIYAQIRSHFRSTGQSDGPCMHEQPANRPEWQHQVRQALDGLKRSGKVTKPKWGYWTIK